MRAVLSLKLWLIFIGRIINAVFPTIWVLLVFAWREKHRISKGSPLLFFFIFLATDITFRLFLFFAGVPYQGRYLYVLAVAASVFGAFGLFGFAGFISSFKQAGFIRGGKCLLLTVAVIAAIHIGKALHFSDEKKWVSEIPELIKKLCPAGSVPVVVSSVEDVRLAYYSNAEFYKFTEPLAPVGISKAALMAEFQGRKQIIEIPQDGFSSGLSGNGNAEILIGISGVMIEKWEKFPPEFQKIHPLPAEIRQTWEKEYCERYKRFEKIIFPTGVLMLEWGEHQQPEDIEIQKLSYPDESAWNVEFSGIADSRQKFFFPRGYPVMFKLKINSREGGEWRLQNIKLVETETWYIWKMGDGRLAGKWLPVAYSGKLEDLCGKIKKMGWDRVFFVLGAGDSEFKKMFDVEKTDFPFKKIREFPDKKGVITLYQAGGK